MIARTWRKLGLVVAIARSPQTWMASHAQVPTALLKGDFIRVYFATRPRPGVTLPAYVDLDAQDPTRVIRFSPKPLLDLGPPGSFDEHGIMPSCVVEAGEAVLLYYSGWSRLGGSAPYHNTTGLAISEDGGNTFRRLVNGPVLDRTPFEPYSATSPWVVKSSVGWHSFYSSGLGWLEVEGKLEHVYDIRSATSDDGVVWDRTGAVAIAQESNEDALTRPTLFQELDGSWSMWFCYRGSRGFRGSGSTYRVGYAHSSDLRDWYRRDDLSGLAASESGWDAQMVAYTCVLRVGDKLLMFYNGNGFGAEGFGIAVAEV